MLKPSLTYPLFTAAEKAEKLGKCLKESCFGSLSSEGHTPWCYLPRVLSAAGKDTRPVS